MSKINTKDETYWRNKPFVPPFAIAVLSFLDVFVWVYYKGLFKYLEISKGYQKYSSYFIKLFFPKQV